MDTGSPAQYWQLDRLASQSPETSIVVPVRCRIAATTPLRWEMEGGQTITYLYSECLCPEFFEILFLGLSRDLLEILVRFDSGNYLGQFLLALEIGPPLDHHLLSHG